MEPSVNVTFLIKTALHIFRASNKKSKIKEHYFCKMMKFYLNVHKVNEF